MRELNAFLLLFFVLHTAASAQAELERVDRESFYSACSKRFPQGLFRGDSKATFDGIFDYWESTAYKDKRWLAYIFATAYRESAGTMQPVREGNGGNCRDDQCSVDAVTAHVDEQNRQLAEKGSKKRVVNYALPVQGKSYFGRGLVQITHKENYSRVGKNLGWGTQLVENPGLALDRQRAIVILVEGAVKGMFCKDQVTGDWAKLDTYLNDQTTDWVGARKIVNPKSSRAHIPAEHAKIFHSCLTK